MKTRIVPEGEDAVFHVVSRMAFGLLNIGDSEKRMFRDMLAKQATFCGVEVLSFCLLDNHFHILVRVPFETQITDAELVKRYKALYSDCDPRQGMTPQQLSDLLKQGGTHAKEMRSKLFARMGSISIFMKELKQRFGIWYNRKYENAGTLWSCRFESVLVENTKKTLQMLGAYIELNPVRLKLCKTAQQYAFCTLGEACSGSKTARKWLSRIFPSSSWDKSLKAYQRVLLANEESLQAGVFSLKGTKTGVIGDEQFVRQWSRYGKGPRKTKRSVPSYIAEGILYAGACFFLAPRDWRGHPGIS